MKYLIFNFIIILIVDHIYSQDLSDTNKLKFENESNFYLFSGASNVNGARIGTGYSFTKQYSVETAIGGALQYEGQQPVIISANINYRFTDKTDLIDYISFTVSYGKNNFQSIPKDWCFSPSIGSTFSIYRNLKLFYRIGYFASVKNVKNQGINLDGGLQFYFIKSIF